jgi:hypothetical protein
VLNSERYAVIEVPPVLEYVAKEFAALPIDPYCGGGQRSRRFSQYKLYFAEREWRLELLPHRPFLQSKEYNAYVGGVQRHLPPLRIDPTPQIAAGAEGIGLPRDEAYQINVHQCRVISNDEIRGVSVPEGPHRDGHEWGMVIVFARENIEGGETHLFRNDDLSRPFFRVTLQPNQAIVYEDGALKHFATDIVAPPRERGHRDLWIVAYNRWGHRRYGEEFERRAMQSV